MIRIEIISNQSVQDDVVQALEEFVPEILYTIIPLVTGRGKSSRKLGSTTWPETNFLLLSYIDDEKIPVIKKIIKAVKEKFPDEGVKLFLVKAEDEILNTK